MPWNRVGTVSTPVTFTGAPQGSIPTAAGGGTGYWTSVRRTHPKTCRPTLLQQHSLLDIDHTVRWRSDVQGRGELTISVPSAEVGAPLFLEVRCNGVVLLRFDGEYSGELECVLQTEVAVDDEVEYVCEQGGRFVPVVWTATPTAG